MKTAQRKRYLSDTHSPPPHFQTPPCLAAWAAAALLSLLLMISATGAGAQTITGTPNTSVAEDSPYSFMPTGNDVDGGTLVYSISSNNQPSWALFDPTTGALTGHAGQR